MHPFFTSANITECSEDVQHAILSADIFKSPTSQLQKDKSWMKKIYTQI